MTKCTCPECHAQFSWATATNDAGARIFMALVASKVPKIIEVRLPAYLGLFRTRSRGLSWERAEKLVLDLIEFVMTPSHSWDRKEARTITADLWADAMDITIGSGKNGFDNHNYLRCVAYDKADPAKIGKKKTGSIPGSTSENGGHYGPPKAMPDYTLSDEQRKLNLERLQNLANNVASKRPLQTLEERQREETLALEQKKQEALKKLNGQA